MAESTKITLEEFFFRIPLYRPYQADQKFAFEEWVFVSAFAVDGHCPHCRRPSTFHSYQGPYGQIFHDVYGQASVVGNAAWEAFKKNKTGALFGAQRDLVCARNRAHILRFWVNAQKITL